MNDINTFLNLNFSSILLGVFIILAGAKTAAALLEWLAVKTGMEFKWMRRKREDHTLLLNTAHELSELSRQRDIDVDNSIRHDKAIREDLEKLTSMFIEKEIDDMRWEILDFASAICSSRSFSKEQYDHIFDQHTKYEKILEDNHMENGRVTTSMEVIRESYKDKLKKGFLNEINRLN